jgi:hypothetical protein
MWNDLGEEGQKVYFEEFFKEREERNNQEGSNK